MARQWLLIGVIALAGGLAGLLAGRWLDDGGSPAGSAADGIGASPAAGDRRPAFELPAIDGGTRSIDEWDGKVVLLNFWATWCAPCREEMPMLDEIQARYADRGLQVVGVALDLPGPVQSFVERLEIDYPILVDDASGGDLAGRYGNSQGVLPFSVLIDRDGRIADRLVGKLEHDPLVKRIERLL